MHPETQNIQGKFKGNTRGSTRDPPCLGAGEYRDARQVAKESTLAISRVADEATQKKLQRMQREWRQSRGGGQRAAGSGQHIGLGLAGSIPV